MARIETAPRASDAEPPAMIQVPSICSHRLPSALVPANPREPEGFSAIHSALWSSKHAEAEDGIRINRNAAVIKRRISDLLQKCDRRSSWRY
jgi:hypothetical protein